jgi:hemerythrin-like metal-binding protein
MSALTWSEAFALQQPRMDDTHREFVDLLAQLEEELAGTPEGGSTRLSRLLDAFVAHTVEHFAQEERCMVDLGFEAENCHAFQHAHVLQVLREVQRRLVEQGDVATLRLLAGELAQWFPIHARSMDAGLALTMAERGYDPETGSMRQPPDPQAALLTGCGSSSCA